MTGFPPFVRRRCSAVHTVLYCMYYSRCMLYVRAWKLLFPQASTGPLPPVQTLSAGPRQVDSGRLKDKTRQSGDGEERATSRHRIQYSLHATYVSRPAILTPTGGRPSPHGTHLAAEKGERMHGQRAIRQTPVSLRGSLYYGRSFIPTCPREGRWIAHGSEPILIVISANLGRLSACRLDQLHHPSERGGRGSEAGSWDWSLRRALLATDKGSIAES